MASLIALETLILFRWPKGTLRGAMTHLMALETCDRATNRAGVQRGV